MSQRVVIVGGGVGGMVVANRLARRRKDVDIALVDGHGDHIHQPGLPHVALGTLKVEALFRDLRPLVHRRVRLVTGRAAGIDAEARTVELEGGEILPYDFLVLATGSRVDPGRVPGFRESALHFHCPRRASALREAVASFRGGDLIVGATSLPYKCPLAPVEMALLLDDHLSRDGRRNKTRIRFVYPLSELSSTQELSGLIRDLLAERDVEVRAAFEVAGIEPEAREIVSISGERLPFGLLILVPPHTVAPVLKDSGLVGDNGFVVTDPRSLKARDGIYALGDNTDLSVPKLGSAALRQAETVVRNLISEVEGRPPVAAYDGSSACLVETGRGRAALVETSQGREVVAARPGRLNFFKKRVFRRLYFRYMARA